MLTFFSESEWQLLEMFGLSGADGIHHEATINLKDQIGQGKRDWTGLSCCTNEASCTNSTLSKDMPLTLMDNRDSYSTNANGTQAAICRYWFLAVDFQPRLLGLGIFWQMRVDDYKVVIFPGRFTWQLILVWTA